MRPISYVGLWLALVAARSIEATGGVDYLFRITLDHDVAHENRELDPRWLERMLFRLSRIVPGVDCKHRAAAACLYLNTCGKPADIVTGFAKIDGAFQGHAWVEYDHGGVFEPAGSNFKVLRRWSRAEHLR